VNRQDHYNPEAPADAKASGQTLPARALKAYQSAGIKELSEEDLVHKYAPLVLKMVHRIAPITRSVVDFDDLKSVGYFALVQAARTFDPEMGVAFEVYCKHRVRGAILDELRKNSPVTRGAYSKWKKLERTIQELEEKLSRTPTEAETASSLGISINEYRQLLDQLRIVSFVSLDEISAQNTDGSDYTPFQLEDLHQQDPASQASTKDLQEIIKQHILNMSPQQKKVLTLYYYEGLRLKDIAMLLNLTESRICQIHTEAILSLRAFLDKEQNLANRA